METPVEENPSRIGISLPTPLMEDPDAILRYRGYSSRSEGVRHAIRTYVTINQWYCDNELLGKKRYHHSL